MDDQEHVFRCDSCSILVRRETLTTLAACPKCGNRRVRNIQVFGEDERKQLEDWGFHDFIAEFEAVDE
tara:strand:- start:993 stop:1196 length:204 start_codon:yes stop_codon:yes gene_type:complete